MTTAPQPVEIKNLRINPLNDPDELRDFDSGEHEVDRHIEKCCDWHGRYRNRTFCAFLPNQELAVGFYCLGISATESKYLDDEIVRSHGSFRYVPFIYLNYLAVRSEHQNNKIGTVLLMNALERCAHTILNIGIYGVALHALNDRSAGLYDRYGFREYGERKKYPFMILPAQSVLDLFT
ncbi:MAG: GNAT family N-acetyltransferase [Proteobacteria bacterium]|nr:GNAT family N-acetyltransferase [Pseudomonadota bacterium]